MQGKNKIRNTWITFLLVIGSSYALYYYNHHHYFTAELNRDLDKAAAEVNKMCPAMVDKNTRIDNAEIPESATIQYNMTLVNIVKAEVDTNQLRSIMQPQVIEQFKTRPQSKPFRDNDVTMISTYRDKNGEFLLKIIVTPDDYK